MTRRPFLWILYACFSASSLFGTTCYTDCEARFPKWYQGPDRQRCQAEKAVACFDPSKLPGATDLSAFDAQASELQTRIERDFTQGGYVVSRAPDGSVEHVGDSALWTAITMASVSCSDTRTEDALVDSLMRNDGRWIRIDPLPASYKGNETSRDMETGAVFGFAVRYARCPASRPRLKKAWQAHRDFVLGNGGRLHEGSNWNFVMTPGFRFVWDLVSYRFGFGSKPSAADERLFEAALVSGAKAIKMRKDACYPIHLSTLQAIAAAKLGMPIIDLAKREFCSDTRGLGLPLTDWFCDRGGAKEFLRDFKVDQWEYRHQRCSAWESPDVSTGERTPGVDFLVLWSLAGGK